MNLASLTKELNYHENRPAVTVLLKTESTKEVRILMKKGQLMKEHKAPFPIVVAVFEGEINFGVNGIIQNMKKGDLIALDKNVPHDLHCTEDAIIRLSVSVLDNVKRVKDLV